MNMLQMLSQFIAGAKHQHGNDFNPEQTAKKMLGFDCQTPQQALDAMLQSGRINQQQYNIFKGML